MIVAQCMGTTAAVVNTGDLATDCATAGGTLQWFELETGLPELSLADGGLIGGAILALWATAYFFRLFARQIRED